MKTWSKTSANFNNDRVLLWKMTNSNLGRIQIVFSIQKYPVSSASDSLVTGTAYHGNCSTKCSVYGNANIPESNKSSRWSSQMVMCHNLSSTTIPEAIMWENKIKGNCLCKCCTSVLSFCCISEFKQSKFLFL